MRPSLLDLIACPGCRGGLRLEGSPEEGEVLDGRLECGGCGASYPVRGGVPRFVGGSPEDSDDRTAAAFGWEWHVFSRIDDHHERQFLDWIAPAAPDSFRGKIVLEGGCGKGRHTRLAAGYGARAVIGVDLSDAVDVAWRNTRHLPNAHIVQADLLRLPLRPGSCDYAFSVGVLHHLEKPEHGFRSLVGAIRPGGTVSIWVYGAEKNAWIARVVSPLRRAITSRLPPRALWLLSMILAAVLEVALVTLYRPARRPGLAWLRPFLFYYPYLSYISGFPFREIHHIVHDHLAAPVAHYLKRDEVARWYGDAGMEDAALFWHNGNSWRGHGSRPRTGGGAAAGRAAGGA